MVKSIMKGVPTHVLIFVLPETVETLHGAMHLDLVIGLRLGLDLVIDAVGLPFSILHSYPQLPYVLRRVDTNLPHHV